VRLNMAAQSLMLRSSWLSWWPLKLNRLLMKDRTDISRFQTGPETERPCDSSKLTQHISAFKRSVQNHSELSKSAVSMHSLNLMQTCADVANYQQCGLCAKQYHTVNQIQGMSDKYYPRDISVSNYTTAEMTLHYVKQLSK